MEAPLHQEAAGSPREDARPATASEQERPIWRNRPYMWLLTGFTSSVFGDSFNGIALSLWVLQTTGSARRMAAVQICSMAIAFLFGSFAGTLADRMDRRKLMLLSDGARCVIAALLGVSLFVLDAPFPVMLGLVSLAMFAGLLHGPAFHASTTQMVGAGRVQQASSSIYLFDNAARISGLALAGVVVSAFGGLAAILTTSAAYLLSFVCTLLAGRFPSAARTSGEAGASFLRDWRSGLSYIRRDALIRSIVILSPLLSAFFLVAIMLVQVIAIGDWKAGPIEFGLIEMCVPLGYVTGAGLLIAFGHRLTRRGRLVFLGLLLLGPVYGLISMMKSPHAAIPLVLMGGLLFSFCSMITQIILKSETSSEWQGRVFGTVGAFSSVAPSLGLAVASVFADRWGAADVLAWQSAGLFVCGVFSVYLLKSIREYR
ncbi:MFS transporter [Cohnella fermenti]|uniref:MFS transporter n=1 Tax=Cohnella fermenti TaxID=2565925 RepID=A0A4S4BQS1_9BACL|nr:MFS transporter [Cohnella fermenti]THF77294.1 MFS transporter [Cohnella fermenti]